MEGDDVMEGVEVERVVAILAERVVEVEVEFRETVDDVFRCCVDAGVDVGAADEVSVSFP